MTKLHFGSRRLAKYLLPLAVLVPAALGIAYAIGKLAPESAEAALAQGHASSQGPARLALILANSDYPEAHAPLPHVMKDAQGLAAALRRTGFSVDIKTNLGGAQMKRTIEGFRSRLKPGAVALVYFAGYGIQVERQSYAVPVDAKIWSQADIRRDGISIDSVLADMHRSGAGVKLAILDASRRNPFERRFRGLSAGLTAIDAPPGTLLLSAAAPGKLVDEREGTNSLMIDELLRQIEAPGISAEAAFNRTRIAVSRASNGEQVPLVSSSLAEDFSFATALPRTTRISAANKVAALTVPTEPAPVLHVTAAEPPALLHVTDASERPSEPVPAIINETPSQPAAAVVETTAPVSVAALLSDSDARPELAPRPVATYAATEEVQTPRIAAELPRRPARQSNREIVREQPRTTQRRSPSSPVQSNRDWRLAQSVFAGPVLGISY